MNRRLTNVLLVMAVALIYVGLGAYSGRTSVNGGLGPEGPIYAAMITAHDVAGWNGGQPRRGLPSRWQRRWRTPSPDPSRPASSSWVCSPFSCWRTRRAGFLDAAGRLPCHQGVCAVLTLGVLGLPTAITAFAPAQPYSLASR